MARFVSRDGKARVLSVDEDQSKPTIQAYHEVDGSSGIDVTRYRSAWWVPAIVLAAVDGIVAMRRSDLFADLHVYVGAIDGLRNGQSLYDFVTSNDAPFTYPPFAALVLFPATYLPERLVGTIWTLVTILVVVAIAFLVARDRRTGCPAESPKWLAPGLAAALFVSAPVSSNLRFGQVSVLLAALVLVDVVRLRGGRFAGVLTGIAAAIKLTPLIFIPMWWFTRQRRAAVTAAATFLAAAGLAWLVLPGDSARFWGTEIFNVNRVGHIATFGNQSFNGAMLRLGVDDRVRTVLMLVVAAVVGILALRRAAAAGAAGDWVSAVTIVGTASLVISPVSWTHHQIWLVLGAVLPIRGSARVRYAWIASVLMIMVLPATSLGLLASGAGFTLLGDVRLLLAIVIACVVPLRNAAAPPQVSRPLAPRQPDSAADTHLPPADIDAPAVLVEKV